MVIFFVRVVVVEILFIVDLFHRHGKHHMVVLVHRAFPQGQLSTVQQVDVAGVGHRSNDVTPLVVIIPGHDRHGWRLVQVFFQRIYGSDLQVNVGDIFTFLQQISYRFFFRAPILRTDRFPDPLRPVQILVRDLGK